jgi:hypothetical protein
VGAIRRVTDADAFVGVVADDGVDEEDCGTRRSRAGEAGAELKPRSCPSKSDNMVLRLDSRVCLSLVNVGEVVALTEVTRFADAGSGVEAADSERALLISISPTLILRLLLWPYLCCTPSTARARTVFSGERERERGDFADGEDNPPA